MAVLAESLPIAFIPEQFLITPVRYDMIDYRCRGYFFLLQALHAQRVPLEIQLSSLSPPGIISTGGSPTTQCIQ